MTLPAVIKEMKDSITSVGVAEIPVKAPETPPMDSTGIAYGIGGIATSIIGALLFLRKKIPSDSLEIKKDRIEGELLSKVMAERDAAVKRSDEFSTKHSADAALIAGLQERNRYLQEEVTRLNKVVDKLEAQFDELKTSVRTLTHESRKPIQSHGNADTNPGGGPSTK